MGEETKKVIEMVEKGIADKEIMRELGIKTKGTLRKMYYDALVEAGKVKGIMTEREVRKAKASEKVLKIGKRGTMSLSRDLLIDQLGFNIGDKFVLAKRRENIILRKKQD